MHIDAFILGAGGHGKVVMDALVRSGGSARLFDADPARVGCIISGAEVELQPALELLPNKGHLAIGDNTVRSRLFKVFSPYLSEWMAIIHPHSVISEWARVGEGCFIAASTIVAPGARLGCATIVNHGVVVDHDCEVGSFCHIAPNSTLGGGVIVGDGVLIGSGAVILPNVKVGRGAQVGSGAVVTRDVPAGVTVVGVPARIISND